MSPSPPRPTVLLVLHLVRVLCASSVLTLFTRGGVRDLRALLEVSIGLAHERDMEFAERAVDQPARSHDGVGDAAPPQQLLAWCMRPRPRPRVDAHRSSKGNGDGAYIARVSDEAKVTLGHMQGQE